MTTPHHRGVENALFDRAGSPPRAHPADQANAACDGPLPDAIRRLPSAESFINKTGSRGGNVAGSGKIADEDPLQRCRVRL